MGQTASAELAELTECVIDPPQNVASRIRAEGSRDVTRTRGAEIKGNHGDAEPGGRGKVSQRTSGEYVKYQKEQPESRGRVEPYRGNARVDTASKRSRRGGECCQECG